MKRSKSYGNQKKRRVNPSEAMRKRSRKSNKNKQNNIRQLK
jgi:hypothetical protein